jgi:hypothetical protein
MPDEESGISGNDPFKKLMLLFKHIENRGGRSMAVNLLRMSARDELYHDQIDALIRSIKEIAG